ncbi:hypothetical protein BDZ97DRAFT_1914360 [Flammula alnicola]|nr:hypothetical protein BDZ97DRAFT_1914360 [Flammula alnicola]
MPERDSSLLDLRYAMEVCHEAAPRVYNGFVVFDDWLEGQLAELEEMCERITGYRLEAVENVDGWVRRIPLPKPSSSTDSPPEEGTSTGSCVSPQGSGFPHDHVSVTTPDSHPFSSISSADVPFSGMVPPKLSENPPIPPASGSGSFGSSMKRKLEDVYSEHELNE